MIWNAPPCHVSLIEHPGAYGLLLIAKQKHMDIKELVDRYLTFWGEANIDGLISMYDDNMVYHDLPSGEVILYGDLMNYLSRTFAFGADQKLELKEAVFLDGGSAFIYWTLSFATEDRGKIIGVNGVELIVFRSEKIISIHEFYDYQGFGTDTLGISRKEANIGQLTKLGLTDELMESIGDEIVRYFDEQRPYLDPELNLTKVSERLGHTRNQISYVINHVLDQTFYDLVNERRIDHVIRQMLSSNSRRSILEMAINAGFNSMSGFYNTFKKQTDMSPVQFQKANLVPED